MMPETPERPPETWKEFRLRTGRHWARHALYVDWFFGKVAWYLSRWSLLKVLAYAETFSVLVALIFWVTEAPARTQQKHYQAWQVINTAQGKGGSGGRGDALEQLNEDHVPLIGVDVAEAFLQDLHLEKAELRRAIFHNCDLRRAHLKSASLADTTFTSANLRNADVRNADLTQANFSDADLTGANFAGANAQGMILDRADLTESDLGNLRDWQSITASALTNIHTIKNAPAGLAKWATDHGAVDMADAQQWNKAIEAAERK